MVLLVLSDRKALRNPVGRDIKWKIWKSVRDSVNPSGVKLFSWFGVPSPSECLKTVHRSYCVSHMKVSR